MRDLVGNVLPIMKSDLHPDNLFNITDYVKNWNDVIIILFRCLCSTKAYRYICNLWQYYKQNANFKSVTKFKIFLDTSNCFEDKVAILFECELLKFLDS